MNGLYIETIALLIHRSIGPKFLLGGVGGGLHLVELADVGGNRQGLAAQRFDLAFGPFEPVAAAREQARASRRVWRAGGPSPVPRRPRLR